MLSEYSPPDTSIDVASTLVVPRQCDHASYARLVRDGVPELLARLYASRGISARADIDCNYADLLPVDAMHNARAAGGYLADCLDQQRRVLIVSDYDCDGATACSVLVMAFGAMGMNFDYLVPDRMVHGYGLTPAIVEEAASLEPKPEVIITVDNGISSHAGIERARELGIEVIVTDHHLAPQDLPPARLIVNPNQADCDFPSKNIAGCGVAWYVARALVEEVESRGQDPGFDPAELLSYVALGTVADVVKLDRNNRILVSIGLDYIRKGLCAPGILALAAVSGKNYETLSCSDIGFGLGPRINAAGRLAHMGAGIECLTTLEPEAADALAAHLHVTNEERKEIQRSMVEEAMGQADNLLSTSWRNAAAEAPRSIVVFNPEWHEGVVGIVAGRIKEERHRPTVVMTMASDGNIKGSARSIPGFHLKHALDEINITHPGVLLKFGGHAMAAGMTIAADKLEVFREALEDVCRTIPEDLLTKTVNVDGALPARFFEESTIRHLSMQVWGQGFEEPIFLNSVAVHEAKVIGSDKSHLKISGSLPGDSRKFDVMAFGRAAYAEEVIRMGELKLAFKAGLNEFRGRVSLQLLVELLPQQMRLAPAAAQAPAPATAARTAAAGLARPRSMIRPQSAAGPAATPAATPDGVDQQTDQGARATEVPRPRMSQPTGAAPQIRRLGAANQPNQSHPPQPVVEAPAIRKMRIRC